MKLNKTDSKAALKDYESNTKEDDSNVITTEEQPTLDMQQKYESSSNLNSK